jgi:UDP-N-acetylglucosamine 2-epimerase (non-hydrolysing)
VTLHRPSNVDQPETLRGILEALDELAESRPVVFPIHPRTRKTMAAIGFTPSHPGFRIVEPLGYLDFLRLESQAALVVTDSGGIQEETTYLGIPCLTVRPNTERPITISQGTNRLVPGERGSLIREARAALDVNERRRPSIELWDGRTAARILAALRSVPDRSTRRGR